MNGHSQSPQYIPVGCVSIRRDELDIDEPTWNLLQSSEWKWFSLAGAAAHAGMTPTLGEVDFLAAAHQELFLKSPFFANYARLLREGWIRLQFKIAPMSGNSSIFRLYFLPDDAQRTELDRSDVRLSKSRQAILRVLDYSKPSWQGHQLPINSGRPVESSVENAQDVTLLQLFNEIPSPKPDPDQISDHHARDAMFDLARSDVAGLKTPLHPYQRRSAALMLQKETQPGSVLDPRLLRVRGPDNNTWYLDPVVGSVLRGPRMYENVFGGILAEEMGSGKTLICLALILATKNLTAAAPEIYGIMPRPVRKRVGSLLEMAASCATRNSVPWKKYFQEYEAQDGYEFSHCIDVLKENPGYYLVPTPVPRRSGRRINIDVVPPPTVKYLSATNLVIVPNNLLSQWKQEIDKHTTGLKVLVLSKLDVVPVADELIEYDILLFAQTKFEQLVRDDPGFRRCPLSEIHFKRCLIDEGHVLGNSKMNKKSNLLMGLDCLSFSSRWIVTGTPSQGLFGVDSRAFETETQAAEASVKNQRAMEMEKRDLERIGSISALYLKSRPWANTITEPGDTMADWGTYLMLPRHSNKARGRADCLRSTLNSLIVRHPLDEVGDLLPSVDEKVVVLDGSYQDRLSLNIFSMMIIFNAVQSERTDRDYFFHPKQRKSLLQIVHNLKQTSFFGGSFFTADELKKAIETAESFLREKKVPVTPADEELLNNAIQFGHMVVENQLRNLSNLFHEIPVTVTGLPASARSAWALDDRDSVDTCTSSGLLLSLQRVLHDSAKQPEKLNSLLNGGLVAEGFFQKGKVLEANTPAPKKTSASKDKKPEVLAGNTRLGDDSPRKSRVPKSKQLEPTEPVVADDIDIGPLSSTLLTATVSAKLSYLIDSVIQHQEEEKIIIFYENDNVAWYLASVLDVVRIIQQTKSLSDSDSLQLQVQHLIYAKGLTVERRAQYVNTFHHNPIFR